MSALPGLRKPSTTNWAGPAFHTLALKARWSLPGAPGSPAPMVMP